MNPAGVKKPIPRFDSIIWRMNSIEFETMRGVSCARLGEFGGHDGIEQPAIVQHHDRKASAFGQRQPPRRASG